MPEAIERLRAAADALRAAQRLARSPSADSIARLRLAAEGNRALSQLTRSPDRPLGTAKKVMK